MNVTRRQIKRALEMYETNVAQTGHSSGLEMMLYEALNGVARGKIIDVPLATVAGVEELTDLPPGSVITSPLPDTESNVAEKTSDGMWLITGEEQLYLNEQLAVWADAPWSILRKGYGDA